MDEKILSHILNVELRIKQVVPTVYTDIKGRKISTNQVGNILICKVSIRFLV